MYGRRPRLCRYRLRPPHLARRGSTSPGTRRRRWHLALPPLQPSGDDLRWLQRDPAQHHREIGIGTAVVNGSVDAEDDEVITMLRHSIERYGAEHYDFERRWVALRNAQAFSPEAWSDYARFGWL